MIVNRLGTAGWSRQRRFHAAMPVEGPWRAEDDVRAIHNRTDDISSGVIEPSWT